MTRAAVLGSGSWGTAFARVMAHAGCSVTLWARRPALAEAINARHENPDYLDGIVLPVDLRATADPAEAVDGVDIVVLAVPSQTARENLLGWAPLLPPEATLVSLMKGIELGTSKRMSEVISEMAGVAPDHVAVVTGPNLAREIAEEQPAATVVACTDHDRAVQLQESCQTPYLRPYTNSDVVGCELGGTVKNIIALACGMVEGMGFGDNTRASLMTRGLAETARLGLVLGAEPATFAGLAGLGDLVATCSSPLSRNRTFGERLGRGQTLAQVLETTVQIAEGVKSCRSVLDLAHAHGVDMPITEAVVAICHGGERTADVVRRVMNREPKPE
ncbi:MAG: NAD(P)-dependent glycerol-3-phosphate dehydrogenase [Geodermatophilaceae bacterium]|nr:NAD(P)-dependent glycerol-3-phosphate dehydrogenase [Geodermatophilaceae bacterium]MDQ3456812.1 NAD(P)-dependent glycerol-3-phosphate dehydrogenase [Actinomycetota bacterium]